MTQFVNPFTGITHAKASLGGDNLEPGEGLVEIDEIKMIVSQNPKTKGDQMFIANFKVWVWDPATGTKDVPVGARRSWVNNMKKQPAMGNCKLFLCAMLNISEEEFEKFPPEEAEQLSMSMLAKEQPFKGTILHVETKMITTKENQPFTKHTWSWPSTVGAAKAEAARARFNTAPQIGQPPVDIDIPF